MLEFFKKNKTLILILFLFVFIPFKVDASTISVQPDHINFYRGYNNTLLVSDTSLTTSTIAGNTFYTGHSGFDNVPLSARIFYKTSQFVSVPKNKNYTLMFTLFSQLPIVSVMVDTASNYFTCDIFNTSYYDYNNNSQAMVYSVYCPKMQFVSSNFYINVNFANDDVINSPLGVLNTFTYLEDTTAQEIVDGIQGEDKPQTPVDDSKVNDYESKEEALVNKDSLDKIDDINISIDSNANLFIWDVIENVLNTHELIFGMIITLLSIGVIKLILNR